MTFVHFTRNACILLLSVLWIVPPVSASGAVASNVNESRGRIGLLLTRDGQVVLPTVGYVAAQGPAAQAGVQVADGVVTIDKVPTTGLSMTQLDRSMDGPVGTVVRLILRRAGAEDLEVAVVRSPFLVAFGPAAAAGDPVAQYQHGLFYENSPGIDQALAQAAVWYRKAAEGNYALAQLRLGEFLDGGWGVHQDSKEATQWYEKAARQGNAVAERQIGLCYLYGRGVARDYQSAFGWFEQSAQQDDTLAEECLAYLYRVGRGTVQNDQAAFAWYYRSAQQDNATAEANVASAYSAGRGVAQDYQAAFAWYYQAAVRGDARGQWNLASLYSRGKGVKRDREEALRWYEKAVTGLPDDQQLKRDLMWARLGVFVESPGSLATFDPSTLPAATKSWLLKAFFVLIAGYLIGGIALCYATVRAGNAAVNIPTAVGWIAFLAESQVCALAGLCVTTTAIAASTLLGAMSALSALPVIASSCGPARRRFWRKPPVSTRTLWLCGLVGCAGLILVGVGYNALYTLLAHSRPPVQPTIPFLIKARTASPWVSYVSAAFLLPTAEELIFRGYLFDALRRYFSDMNVIIITSLVFSAVHIQWIYFIPIAGVGLVLGWTKYKTDSLWLPVSLHIINNSIAMVFSSSG